MMLQIMPIIYQTNENFMANNKKPNFLKIKLTSLFNLLFIMFLGMLMTSCGEVKQDKEDSEVDFHKEEIAQKNLELELKQKELELKSQELEILKQNQEKEPENKQFNATELFDKYNRSVFKIYVLNEFKELHITGTGFLIGDEGYAVTNYHVLQNANNAYIEMINGDIIDIDFDKIVGYNNQDDFVIFK